MSLCVMSVGGLRSLVATCHERGGSQQPRTHVFQAWRWGGVLATIQPCGMSVEVSAAMHPRVTSHGGGGVSAVAYPRVTSMRVSADVYPHVMSMGGGGLSSRVLASHEGGMAQELCTHVTSVGGLSSHAPTSTSMGEGGCLSSRLPRSEAQGVSAAGHTPPTPPPPPVSQTRGSWALIGRVRTCHEHVRPQPSAPLCPRVLNVPGLSSHAPVCHQHGVGGVGGGLCLSIPHPHIA